MVKILDFINFDSRNPLYKSIFGAIKSGESLKLRLCLPENSGVWYAYLLLRRDGDAEDKVLEMTYEYKKDGSLFYSVEISPETGLYWYAFSYKTEFHTYYINRGEKSLGRVGGGGRWQLTVYDKSFSTPKWLEGGLIYQIFPDRFCKDGRVNPKKFPERFINPNWGELPEHRYQKGELKVLGNDFFGGSLKGIIKKLPYLQSLGVTCIYLNPIFFSMSNHRYNTADYEKIDPMLGSERDFKTLCQTAKKLGIHIILDGVFSHTGDDSRYFDRYNKFGGKGAYSSPDSPYYSWYKFKNWPSDYHSWWGIDTLPEVNEDDESFLDYICGDDGIAKKWLNLGADGWRLDVADELPDIFLDRLRLAVKSENPEAFILGEVWEDATNKVSYGSRRRYLLGNQLDSVMNYPFSNAIINFIKWGNGHEFAEAVLEVCENYPTPALHLLMNHIGTHDTPRILTLLGSSQPDSGDREIQAVTRLGLAEYLLGVKKQKCAAVLQYTLPGVPSLYYGDEAGMEGYGDPFCRGCFPWGNENLDLTNFYKELGQMRKSSPCLKDGSIFFLKAEKGLVAFIRESEAGSILVAVNASDYPQSFALPENLQISTLKFGSAKTTFEISLSAFGYAVYDIYPELP